MVYHAYCVYNYYVKSKPFGISKLCANLLAYDVRILILIKSLCMILNGELRMVSAIYSYIHSYNKYSKRYYSYILHTTYYYILHTILEGECSIVEIVPYGIDGTAREQKYRILEVGV